MEYIKDVDKFKITINENQNINHQITDFIHELSHVIWYLQNFKKKINTTSKRVYTREKGAIEIEIEILKKISTVFFEKYFYNETLLLLHKTLFEIETYKNPKQNLKKLYASIFNKCFSGVKQKENVLYILDYDVIFNPFSSLPHTIAHINLLSKNLI